MKGAGVQMPAEGFLSAFRRHRVGSAERCTETIFTDHQRQVCDYALVYAEKKNDGEAPYSVSFTATLSGDVIVQLHPYSQLERAVRHERQAQATEPPASPLNCLLLLLALSQEPGACV